MFHRHHIISGLAVALSAAVLGAAPALAHNPHPRAVATSITGGTGSDVQTGGGNYTASTSAPTNPTEGTGSDVQTGGGNYGGAAVLTVTHSSGTVAHTSGFDWGKAAIIAGGALLVLLAAAGAVFATGIRRTRRAVKAA